MQRLDQLVKSSTITGQRQQVATQQPATGTPSGERGLAMISNLTALLSKGKSTIETSKAIKASLKQELKLRPNYATTTEVCPSSYEILSTVDQSHVDFIRAATAPMAKDKIVFLLTAAYNVLAHRNQDNMDRETTISMFARVASDYPADVVDHVIGGLLKPGQGKNKFFPSFHELGNDLEMFGRDRLNLRDAIERAVQ